MNKLMVITLHKADIYDTHYSQPRLHKITRPKKVGFFNLFSWRLAVIYVHGRMQHCPSTVQSLCQHFLPLSALLSACFLYSSFKPVFQRNDKRTDNKTISLKVTEAAELFQLRAKDACLIWLNHIILSSDIIEDTRNFMHTYFV